MNITPMQRPGNGNPGIVPPWLQKPPVITLPVEPASVRVLVGVVPPATVGKPLLGASS